MEDDPRNRMVALPLLPKRSGISGEGDEEEVQVPLQAASFSKAIRMLQLDHSQSGSGVLSWIVAALLVVVVPILKLLYVKAAEGNQKLVFQPLVTIVGALMSSVAFLFVYQKLREHGIRGFLFLDSASEEAAQVQKGYQSAIEGGMPLLAKLFLPALLLYAVQRGWLYTQVELQPLPLGMCKAADMAFVVVMLALSWTYQTTTYLYACILFWKVCVLQELKVRRFKQLLGKKLEPEVYFHEYMRIIRGMRVASHRFRLFLALIGLLNIFGPLASMYQIVEYSRRGVSIYMAGELLVLNMVNLTGMGLCLRSASRIAHLHRKVVKTACVAHALQTFHGSDNFQEACARRAALVTFLSHTTVGISVYGFVLDRFFVHTSIGGLLTTTWFILGRSLV